LRLPAAALLLLTLPWTAAGQQMVFRDYIHLRTEMSEAQVLYRVGPPTYENVLYGYSGAVFGKIWYYIPEAGQPDPWITEVHFDWRGKVIRIDRNRP
jgi:hypothetical protein